MKKTGRRFETVSLAEVLKNATEITNDGKVANRDSFPAKQVRRQFEGKTEAKGRAKRILVVDDEEVIADTLVAIFRNSGYEAMAAYDGLSGLSQCESFFPDLVITDVMMPGMDGITMAIQMRNCRPDCRILLFSGQAATANLLAEAKRSGHDFELLAKPVHPSELLARVEAVDAGPGEGLAVSSERRHNAAPVA